MFIHSIKSLEYSREQYIAELQLSKHKEYLIRQATLGTPGL